MHLPTRNSRKSRTTSKISWHSLVRLEKYNYNSKNNRTFSTIHSSRRNKKMTMAALVQKKSLYPLKSNPSFTRKSTLTTSLKCLQTESTFKEFSSPKNSFHNLISPWAAFRTSYSKSYPFLSEQMSKQFLTSNSRTSINLILSQKNRCSKSSAKPKLTRTCLRKSSTI